MQPDTVFEMKPGNNNIQLKLRIVGFEDVNELLDINLRMDQAETLSKVLDSAIKEAKKIHQIIENAGDVPALEVRL